jgi:hypothetical protein
MTQCSFLNCKKKISFIDYIVCKCKCKLYNCILHRLPEDHNCTYNFKSEIDTNEFINKNKCVSDKIIKI